MKTIIEYLPEFNDVLSIVEEGARKHGQDTWLDPDNVSMLPSNNYKSIMGHVAKAYAAENKLDEESGYDHRLHAICRLIFDYAREKRYNKNTN